MERDGFSKVAKKKMLISPATLLGIRMTGIATITQIIIMFNDCLSV